MQMLGKLLSGMTLQSCSCLGASDGPDVLVMLPVSPVSCDSVIRLQNSLARALAVAKVINAFKRKLLHRIKTHEELLMATAWVRSITRWSPISCLLGKALLCIYPFSCRSSKAPFQLLRVVVAICCFYTGLQILLCPQHPAGIRKHPLTFPSGKEAFRRKRCQRSAYLQLNGASLCVCDG